jgi:uncharacterized protein (TIGR00730 family)
MRSVCVFLGSSSGTDPALRDGARAMGAALAEEGLALVYGGGSIGLMGEIADAALRGGGKVIGVITEGLEARELGHGGLTEKHVVRTMHERKALMADLADAFVALPGGMGTLDEFCEVVTWAQLGIHQKPLGMLDLGEYWTPFLSFLDHSVAKGFVSPEHRGLILVERDPRALLGRLRAFRPRPAQKWLGRSQV